VTKLHTIEIDVGIALQKIAVLNHLNPGGRLQATRKNLPVIVVVLDHAMPVNCWFIMWMAISTTPIHAI
jgi:hypothetical protein